MAAKGDDPEEVSASGKAEIERRLETLLDGSAVTLSPEEVLQRAWQRLAEIRERNSR